MNTRTPQRSDLPTRKRVGTRQESHLADVARLALNIKDACQALSVSWDVWNNTSNRRPYRPHRHTRARASRRSQRWLADDAETTLSDHA